MSQTSNSKKAVQPPQQALMAQALASAANPIFITDEVGQVIWVNNAFVRLSGYTPEDAIGRTPAFLQSGRQSHAFYSKMWQTIMAGQVWKGEVVDQRKDGSSYAVEEVITPLFDKEGVITHFLAIQHDVTERKKESEHDHYLAYHDVLTGLPNRAFFLDVQQKAISHAKRSQHMIATLFLDLDGFKPINDEFGHHMGDQLLVAVAERLRATVRQADAVARFGGDEFAVLITDIVDVNIAATLSHKLNDILSKPFVLRGQKFNIHASVGIAIYPTDGENPETLLANADKAMYQAKYRGGNNFQFYDAKLDQDTNEHVDTTPE
ncbi:MAG: diguanylate cyclase domain-containing protein [Burkholderiaceae bacterium]